MLLLLLPLLHFHPLQILLEQMAAPPWFLLVLLLLHHVPADLPSSAMLAQLTTYTEQLAVAWTAVLLLLVLPWTWMPCVRATAGLEGLVLPCAPSADSRSAQQHKDEAS